MKTQELSMNQGIANQPTGPSNRTPRAILLELQEENRRGDGVVWLALAISALALVMLSILT